MDALKKAEEEKKQAAKRLQEVEIETREISTENNNAITEDNVGNESETTDTTPELFTETAQFSLEPLSLEERIEEVKDEIKDDELSVDEKQWEIETVDASEVFSEDLTLENTVSEEIEPKEVFEETQKVIDLNDTTIIEGLSTENASAPFDDTFHGVLFEEDDQETEIYEETLPGIPADQLAKDLGGGKYQPTPVAAKTVFSAGRPSQNKASFKWGILVVLALLAMGSFGVFYYFTITPVSRTLPSPLIARGIETSGFEPSVIVQEPVIQEIQETEVITGSISEPVLGDPNVEVIEETFDSQPVKEELIEDSKLIAEQSENISRPEVTEVENNEAIESTELVEATEKKVDEYTSNEDALQQKEAVVETNEVESIEEKMDVQIVEATQDKIQADASLINISKSKNLNEGNVMVNQAYRAYQDGHYDAAKSIYEDVLKNDPDNRDAHLGLGAIAVGKKDRKQAYAHYVHLLELNPLDTIAMNALISLSNSADPIKDESAIKLLIAREGDIPALYFSLGNLYAKQQRWTSAQQAFFDAYRLDSTNPDYVINLAISLDRMGQYNSALDYYKTAMDLSNYSSASFDTVKVKNRILALAKLIETKS